MSFARVLRAVDDRGRVEQRDQLGEGLRLAVVRRRAGQDQRVGLRGKQSGEFVVLGAAVDQVVALVDDDGVPRWFLRWCL